MQTAILSENNGGFEIPRGVVGVLAMFAVAVAACLFAAVVVQGPQLGSVIALSFALPMGFLLWQARKDIWHNATKRLCACFMVSCLVSMIYAPGFLNLMLGWLLLVTGAVVMRGEVSIEPLQLIGASVRQFFGGIGRSVLDGMGAVALLLHVPAASAPKISALLLPALAGLVFAALLIAANPLLDAAFSNLHFASFNALFDVLFSATSLWFVFFLALLWPGLRGSAVVRHWQGDSDVPLWHRTFFQPGAVIATLLLLNLMFAGQNLLDLSFVWSDVKLPTGLTHAQYVHRGSYTLIATALLAAALIMIILRKGSSTEQSSPVRWLVHAWTAQNLLLVASSVKRTLSYINDYGWTEWRVSGLIWMALVFFGLGTVIVRVLKNRDTRWLLNTNLLASLVVLLATSAWNMQGFIAERNVDRVLANPKLSLDIDYLVSLGPSALPALKRVQDASAHPTFGRSSGYYFLPGMQIAQLKYQRAEIQSDWRSWTLKGALITLPPEPLPAMNREP